MLNDISISNVRSGGVWVLMALGVGVLMARTAYDTIGGGLVVGMVLGMLVFFLLRKSILPGDRRFMVQLVIAAAVAKVGATFARIFVSFDVYLGQDAAAYDNSGGRIAGYIRDGEFERAGAFLEPGTSFVELFTGLVYAISGPTLYGGFLVFSFMAFLGSFFFYKAFRVAFPSSNWKLFAVLVFFYPSLLYWPSGLGKDALLFFCLGLCSYGAAQLLVRSQFGGVLPLLLGLAGAYWVRPPIALVLGMALFVAVVIRSLGPTRTPAHVRVLILGGSAVVAWFLLSQAEAFLGFQALSPSASLEYLSNASSNVFEGAGGTSNFATTPPTHPLWVPMAFVTVPLRPFPWEAHNLQTLVQAMDGVLMAGLLIWASPRLWSVVKNSGREPYLLYVLSFTFVAILALSVEGNFGLLARQRATVLPFVLMAVSVGASFRPSVHHSLAEEAS